MYSTIYNYEIVWGGRKKLWGERKLFFFVNAENPPTGEDAPLPRSGFEIRSIRTTWRWRGSADEQLKSWHKKFLK